VIPVRISFPGQLNNAIAATQSITATAGGGVILNGSVAVRSNTTPSATTASSIIGSNQPVVLAGVARPVTIFASSSATNCIFTVIGQDLRGNTITATVIGGTGGATPSTAAALATTNGVDFHIVQGVVSSASVGNFTVGFGATGVTNFFPVSMGANPQTLSVGGIVTATFLTYTVEFTYDNIQTATAPNVATTGAIANIATTSLFAGLTASTAPVTGVRGSVSGNTASSGGVTFVFAQSGY
jgi:hypothetical protein